MTNDPWENAVEQQNADAQADAYDSMVRDQQSIDNEMGEVMSRDEANQARELLEMNNVMASAIKRSGGGMLPESLRNFMNRRFGFDGQSTGFLGGGFAPDGSYVFRIGNGAGPDGKPQTQDVVFDRAKLYQLAQTNRVAFDDADRARMHTNLLKNGYSENELASMKFTPPVRTTTTMTGEQLRALRGEPRTPSRIESFSADGKGGFSRRAYDRKTGEDYSVDYGTRDPNRQGRWKILESGPDGSRYENDATGEVAQVPKGSTPEDVVAARTRKPTSGLTFDERRQLQNEREDRLDARQRANAESRRETEDERSARHREGRLRAWENAHYNAIQRQIDNMRKAKIRGYGGKEEPQFTEEQIAAREKELYDQFDADRAKAFPDMFEAPSAPEGASQAETPKSDNNSNAQAAPQFKEGDEQTVNGVKMKLLPSKKNPGKLTWQPIKEK